MARKIFTYRGHEVEELKAMPMEELIPILPSRARRSIKRGFSDQKKKLAERIKKASNQLSQGGKPKPIKTHVRDMIVLPEMFGLTMAIYAGKEYMHVIIQPEMLGKYLGELTMTRKSIKHSSPGVGATRSSMFVPIR
ncbi:MAG: 30S ribosomal protein S19 [Candidatus Altiarchaeota archaeon]